MPTYEFDKPHHLSRLHDELIADGITPESVRGQPDGDIFWITVPADQADLVAAVVNDHDGLACKLQDSWQLIRNQRNNLLDSSDWTDLPSTPLAESDRSAWQDYRQALRDLPQSFAEDGPDLVVFPTPPAL